MSNPWDDDLPVGEVQQQKAPVQQQPSGKQNYTPRQIDIITEMQNRGLSVPQPYDQLVSGNIPNIMESTKKMPWEDDSAVEQSTSEVIPYVQDFSSGFYEGVANMAGAPVDVAAWALSPVIGETQPFGGSQSIKGGMESLGLIDEQQTEGGLGRGTRRIGQEVGANVLPAGVILKAAKGLKPVLVGTAGFIRRLLLEPVAKAPLATTAGEFAATAGAGAGAAVATEKKPGSKSAEITGQVVGGMVPAVASSLSLTGLTARLVKKVHGRFSSNKQKEIALEKIKTVLGDALTPEIKEKMKKATELQAKMKEQGIEWNPSLAEITDSPAIMRQQQELEDNASGAFLEQLVQKYKNNENAIDEYTAIKTPESDVSLQYIVDTAGNRIDTFGTEIDTAISGVNMKKQDMADRIMPVDRMVSGKAIRDGINKARSETSIKMSARAEELGIADVDLTEHFDAFRDKIVSKYSPESRFSDKDALPDIYKTLKKEAEVKADIPEEGVPEFDVPEVEEVLTSFNDVKSLRERITDDLRNEIGTTIPNRKKLRTLTRMVKDVDNFLDELEPVLGENYKQFRKEYFENYITPFESGAIFKARNKDGTGFYRTNDEKVASVFLDNPSAAKQYNEIFASDPEMMSAMKDAALDDMKRNAVDDGILDEKKLKAWTKKRGEAIEQIPGLKNEVSDITTAQRQLDNRELQLSNRKKNIENKSFAKKLRTYGKGDVSAGDILDSALKNPIEMRRLKNHVKKSEEALGGLRRTIWEKAAAGSSEDIVLFMAKHDKTLKELFPKSQLRDMYDISLMKAISDRATTPTGTAVKGTELPEILKKVEDLTGMKVPQFGTRLYAYQSGRVPPHYLALEATMTALRKNAGRYSDEIWKEALYDPKTVEVLMEGLESGKLTEKQMRRIGSRVFILGLPYGEEDE